MHIMLTAIFVVFLYVKISTAMMADRDALSLRRKRRSFEINNTTIYNATEFKLNFTGQCRTYQRPCQICEGDCETDLDCAEGLACFIRDSKTPGEGLNVPGCSDNPRHLFAKDFCYNKTLSPCLDLITFDDNNGTSRQCSWVGEEQDKRSRCDMYGHFCRQTCGYCRLGRRREYNDY